MLDAVNRELKVGMKVATPVQDRWSYSQGLHVFKVHKINEKMVILVDKLGNRTYRYPSQVVIIPEKSEMGEC